MKKVFTQTFGVVAAIIEKNGKFLLVKEGKHEKFAFGKWNHPAGWIEVGENPLEAVRREVKEETGFDFQPEYLLGVYSLVKKYNDSTRHPIKLVFLGKIDQGKKEKLSEDVTEAKWFSADEILTMDIDTLRDMDIKKMIRDYKAGKKYSLEIIECAETDYTNQPAQES